MLERKDACHYAPSEPFQSGIADFFYRQQAFPDHPGRPFRIRLPEGRFIFYRKIRGRVGNGRGI